MKDFGRSDDPRVQAQLDRLAALSVPQGRLGLETINALMERLGNPHRDLPPVFHVAGTNGKGSVCAFLRTTLEADGKRVHVTTSPHLVRYNERIRIAGELISDEALAQLLEEVLDAGTDLSPSFFEVTVAAAFLSFSREPADACVVEVGLGGRFDATNVLEPQVLAACGIAALGIDHERFLLAPEDGTPDQPLARIAFEKAGIAKPGIPLVTLSYPVSAAKSVIEQSMAAGSRPAMRDLDWNAGVSESGLVYTDREGELRLPLPDMPGNHQPENAALAVAMLRHQSLLDVSEEAMAEGIRSARWPARFQWLGPGPLTDRLPHLEWLLDGGHNPNAAQMVAEFLSTLDRPVHAVLGMIAGKDHERFLEIVGPHLASCTAVPVPEHDSVDPFALMESAQRAGVGTIGWAPEIEGALRQIGVLSTPKAEGNDILLIGGSLYLAGVVLRLNNENPD